MEKAGERNLVRVKTTKTNEDVPRFRIMSDVDLEVIQVNLCSDDSHINLSMYLNCSIFRLRPESSDQQQGHRGVERFSVIWTFWHITLVKLCSNLPLPRDGRNPGQAEVGGVEIEGE